MRQRLEALERALLQVPGLEVDPTVTPPTTSARTFLAARCLNPQPYTLSPQPYTLNPQPYTLNSQPYTLIPNP